MPRGKPIDADWLRERYPMMTDINELLDDHEREFGWCPTKAAIYMKANRLGIKKRPVAGRHKNCERAIYWSKEPEMESWMLENDHGQRFDELSDAFRERFGFGLSRGQVNIFRASHGTQVRRSHGGGNTRVPVGTERAGKDGYIIVKVREDAIVPMSKDNWMLKHVHVYEKTHGKVPDDHVVYFADGDRRNFDASNLVAVPQNVVGILNGMRARGTTWHDAETLRTMVALAKVQMARNRLAASQERTCPCCGKTFNNLSRLKCGCVSSTVCQECGAAGRKPPHQRARRYDHDKIRRLHADGFRNYQIAEMVGCSPTTVSNVINNLSEQRKRQRREST